MCFAFMIKHMKKDSDKKIALIAGALSLPFLTRDALRKNGWEVFVVGLKNFYDSKLNPDLVVRLGAGGTVIRECKKRGIRKFVFVGALGHVNLSDIRPDLWSLSLLYVFLQFYPQYPLKGQLRELNYQDLFQVLWLPYYYPPNWYLVNLVYLFFSIISFANDL